MMRKENLNNHHCVLILKEWSVRAVGDPVLLSCIKLFTGKCTGLRYWLVSIESTGSPSSLTK